MTTRNRTLYLKHSTGAVHAFEGRRLAKLLSELKAGRGGVECAALVEGGYEWTMGGQCVSEFTYESVLAESEGRFSA